MLCLNVKLDFCLVERSGLGWYLCAWSSSFCSFWSTELFGYRYPLQRYRYQIIPLASVSCEYRHPLKRYRYSLHFLWVNCPGIDTHYGSIDTSSVQWLRFSSSIDTPQGGIDTPGFSFSLWSVWGFRFRGNLTFEWSFPFMILYHLLSHFPVFLVSILQSS